MILSRRKDLWPSVLQQGCWGLMDAAEEQGTLVPWAQQPRCTALLWLTAGAADTSVSWSLTRSLPPCRPAPACSPTGSARQVLSSLSGALPWQPYISLQKQLMAKGLIRELEVPAEFE